MSRNGLSGSNANLSGHHSEAIVDCCLTILKRKWYNPVSQYAFESSMLRAKPWNETGTLRVDQFVRCLPNYEDGLIISVKRQDSGGSASQKLKYAIEHEIKQCYPFPTILVLVGQKWPDEAIKFAKQSIDGQLVDVFTSYQELLLWAESVPPNTNKRRQKSHSSLPLFQNKLF